LISLKKLEGNFGKVIHDRAETLCRRSVAAKPIDPWMSWCLGGDKVLKWANRGRGAMLSLQEARAEVDRWLDQVKLKTGKCSELLRNQLAEGFRSRTISLFAVLDEIGQIEGSDPPCHLGTKPAEPLNGDLQGLMHKHYQGSSLPSFAKNQNNYWHTNDKKRKRKRAEIMGEFAQDGDAGKLAHQLVFSAHKGRHLAREVTGEWIIYVKVAGVNHYLTLAAHKEPSEAIKERVRSCFAEFPELNAQLGW
jgi:hypothetical protein